MHGVNLLHKVSNKASVNSARRLNMIYSTSNTGTQTISIVSQSQIIAIYQWQDLFLKKHLLQKFVMCWMSTMFYCVLQILQNPCHSQAKQNNTTKRSPNPTTWQGFGWKKGQRNSRSPEDIYIRSYPELNPKRFGHHWLQVISARKE